MIQVLKTINGKEAVLYSLLWERLFERAPNKTTQDKM